MTRRGSRFEFSKKGRKTSSEPGAGGDLKQGRKNRLQRISPHVQRQHSTSAQREMEENCP